MFVPPLHKIVVADEKAGPHTRANIMDNQHEPDALDGQGAAVEPDSGGHPLFLRSDAETGPDLRKIDIIQIIRTYPGTNVTETCPYVWKASELRGWDQVVDAYGGGCQYTALGFELKSHRITARSKPHYFASPPMKPFVPVANPAPTPTAPQPNAPPQQPVPIQTAPAGMGPDVAALVHAMVESNTKLICTLVAQSKQPQESALGEILRGVVVPLLERHQQPPPQQNTLEVVREIVPLIKGNGNGDSSKSGGANYERGIERGLELGRSFGGGAPQGDDFGEITKLLGLFKSATGSASPPPPVPPPPPPPPAPPPSYGYAMPALPPPPPGWEWAHTPMGIVMRPIASVQPIPQQYAPHQYAPPPVQYAPAPAPMPPAPPEPVHSQPMPVQPVSLPVAPVPSTPPPVSPAPAAQVPLVSNPVPIAISPPNVPLRQPVPPAPVRFTSMPITESASITEIVPQRRTTKGVAPYLTAAGFIQGPPNDPLNGAPDNAIAAALGDGAALLQDPEFMQKAAAFMAGDLSPDKLGELLAAAERAAGK